MLEDTQFLENVLVLDVLSVQREESLTTLSNFGALFPIKSIANSNTLKDVCWLQKAIIRIKTIGLSSGAPPPRGVGVWLYSGRTS